MVCYTVLSDNGPQYIVNGIVVAPYEWVIEHRAVPKCLGGKPDGSKPSCSSTADCRCCIDAK